ncbi:hypothetical protein PAMP_011871 [Pampus punctatissimus]
MQSRKTVDTLKTCCWFPCPAESSRVNVSWHKGQSLAQPEMDVRFYPAPPANVGSCSLPTDPSCLSPLDYYHSNKRGRKGESKDE